MNFYFYYCQAGFCVLFGQYWFGFPKGTIFLTSIFLDFESLPLKQNEAFCALNVVLCAAHFATQPPHSNPPLIS